MDINGKQLKEQAESNSDQERESLCEITNPGTQNRESTKAQGKSKLEYKTHDYQYCAGLYCCLQRKNMQKERLKGKIKSLA